MSAVYAAIGSSGLPVGVVISFYGPSDPVGWFICDGRDTTGTNNELSTHHPELYNILGDTNVLPDLRGEFIRGAGTNSHTGQGNGGNIGEHQDATGIWQHTTYAHDIFLVNPDGSVNTQSRRAYQADNNSTKTAPYVTMRPTNTSLNYIIKY